MDKIAAAAIERLEAERQRRIEEKVAKGEAVRVPLCVVASDPDQAAAEVEDAKAHAIARLRKAGEQREVIFDEPLVIVTGVPCCGRDESADDEAPPIARAPEDKAPGVEDFHARRQVSEALSAVSKPPPSTLAPRSVEEPAEPLVQIPVHVQVAPPTEDDPGAIIEGGCTLTEDGVLRVYDADGNLLGTEHLAPGADVRAAARRVLREKKAPAEFWSRSLH
jgi:hypothetical protein